MPTSAAAIEASSSDTGKVTSLSELLYRAADRFGVPVAILVMVLWWARTDIVQPLLDAHFGVVKRITEGQDRHTAQLEELGGKLDELIRVSRER